LQTSKVWSRLHLHEGFCKFFLKFLLIEFDLFLTTDLIDHQRLFKTLDRRWLYVFLDKIFLFTIINFQISIQIQVLAGDILFNALKDILDLVIQHLRRVF
jgi:hypothetical protein